MKQLKQGNITSSKTNEVGCRYLAKQEIWFERKLGAEEKGNNP